jgi:hypothetical protein
MYNKCIYIMKTVSHLDIHLHSQIVNWMKHDVFSFTGYRLELNKDTVTFSLLSLTVGRSSLASSPLGSSLF